MPESAFAEISHAIARLKRQLPAARYRQLERALAPLLLAYRQSRYTKSNVLARMRRLIAMYSERPKSRGARKAKPSVGTRRGNESMRMTSVAIPTSRAVEMGVDIAAVFPTAGTTVRRAAPAKKPVKKALKRSPKKKVAPKKKAAKKAAPKKKAAKKAPKVKQRAFKKAAKRPATRGPQKPARTVKQGARKHAATAKRTVKPETSDSKLPRWVQAQVFDLSQKGSDKPVLAFHAGKFHEVRVIIGPSQPEWLVAKGATAADSIDNMLPEGEHKLTVMFFMPSRGTQTGTLTLPETGTTPVPAVFRIKVGAADTAVQALISIVYRGRILQTAVLSGKAVNDPARAAKSARITFRLQVVVPGFTNLDSRKPFDAALVTATHPQNRVVAAGSVRANNEQGKTVYFNQARIDVAARKIRGILESVVTNESATPRFDSKETLDVLWKLAQEGRLLYEMIGEALEHELAGRDLCNLQLLQADASAFIPIEFAYDLPAPANGAKLCSNWKKALAGKACTEDHHKVGRLGQLEVVCPSGFWSISKVIERQALNGQTAAELKANGFGLRAEPTAGRSTLARMDSCLVAWSDILDNAVTGASKLVLKSLNDATGNGAVAVKTWASWVRTVTRKRPQLLVLLSHTVDDALEIGAENSGERATMAQINGRYIKQVEQDAPIAFLLGCDTAVTDDSLYSFVGRFRDKGAAIVVGTITPVLGERSVAVVRTTVAQLASKRKKPTPFGEVIRDARRQLLAQGELTALCATSYGDAGWLVQ